MKIRVTAQNLMGGGRVDFFGRPNDRLELLLERIQDDGNRPHILLLTDAHGWEERRRRTLRIVAKKLGLAPGPLTMSSTLKGVSTVALYDKSVATLVHYGDKQSAQTYHGFGVYGFDLGLIRPVACIPMHLTAFSPTQAMIEAEYMATVAYRCGGLGIVAGDLNYAPAHPDNPPPRTDTWFPYNRKSRALPSSDPRLDPAGATEPNREIARVFARAGMQDAAWYLYDKGGRTDPSLLARTTHDDRIDQILATAPLAPALVEYKVLDLHGGRAFEVGAPGAGSDHHGTTSAFETDLIDQNKLAVWR